MTDVMRGLGLLGGRASLPIPGPLSTRIAGSLLSTALVVDPLTDDPGFDDDDDDEEEEQEEEEQEEDATPRPRESRYALPNLR